MSAGYEALIRISKSPSWGSNRGTLAGQRGIFLYVDSINPSLGADVSQRDNKLLGARESSGSTFSVDRYNSTLEFKYQPRPDDVLPLLMACFQNGTSINDGIGGGTGVVFGTYQFTRIGKNPDYTTNGSNIGTNAYGLDADIFYSNSLVGGGTGANGIRFTSGIVDKLTWNNKYGEDLIFTVNMKFKGAGSRFNFPSSMTAAPNSLGSYSDFPIFVDYMGTIGLTGESVDVDTFEAMFDNASESRSKIGQRGYNRFPFSKHFKCTGNIGMELERELNIFAEGTTRAGTFTWSSSGTATIMLIQHNMAQLGHDIPISGGEVIVDETIPYRAYPTVTGGTSSVVYVFTGSTYGTNLFGF